MKILEPINGVTIGQKFVYQKSKIGEVVDIYEVISLNTNSRVKYMCIAAGINSLATNQFEVPFATVMRYKLS